MDFSKLTIREYILLVIILLACFFFLGTAQTKQMTHIQCKNNICTIKEIRANGMVDPMKIELNLGKQIYPPFNIEKKLSPLRTLLSFIFYTRYYDDEYLYTVECTSEENVHYTFKTYTPSKRKVEETIQNLNNAYWEHKDIETELKP